MTFTEGLPVRVLADGIDINGWQNPEGQMEALEVRFYVDGVLKVTDGPSRGYNHFEAVLTGLNAGAHTLTTESSNYGGVTKTSPFPVTIVIEPAPAKASTINLSADLVLSGSTNLDWQNVRVNGNGFRVTSASGWTGNIIIRNALITGLAVTALEVPNTTNAGSPGIDVTTGGSVTIESSVFEWNGANYFRVNGSGAVSVRHNEFRASAYIPFVSSDPERSPVLQFQGPSTGVKVFQANKVGAGYLYVIGMSNWLIGGDYDSLSNVLIGPRINIRVDNSANIRIKGNYSRHDYYGGWSQGFNFYFRNNTDPFLCEHNVIRQSSWPIQNLSGVFRYNLVVVCGHEWLRTAVTGTEIYRNVFINPELAGNPNAGIWLYGNQTNIKIYNNTLDGGGPGMAFNSPAISVSSGSQISTLRNNLITNFIPGASTAIVDRYLSETDSSARLLYSDYNCFYNPDAGGPNNYGDKMIAGIAEGASGYGGHDIGGLNGQADPRLAQGMAIPYQIEEDRVWKRELLVSQVLADFRARYTPQSGSPLIDAGDPADGGGVDIGAVEAASGVQRDDDLFGKFGGPGAAVEGGRHTQARMTLEAAPNPFFSGTTLHFRIVLNRTKVNLSVYNTAGRLISTFVSRPMEPGAHDITWKASDIPSGVYFAKLRVGKRIETCKLLLMR